MKATPGNEGVHSKLRKAKCSWTEFKKLILYFARNKKMVVSSMLSILKYSEFIDNRAASSILIQEQVDVD